MKFKKIISAAVGAVMLCASLPFSSTTVDFVKENAIIANAEDEMPSSGKCGENVYYFLNDDGVLTISGSGDMTDYYYDESPFCKNTSIKSVVIENGVTSIGSDIFQECTSLKNIEIPNSVTSIRWDAFSDCTNLTDITIPNSVTSIGSEAFLNCTSLTSIIIPDSVTSIVDFTFSGCTNLTSITIPDSIISIGGTAFNGTKWLEDKQKENPLVVVNNILINSKTCSGDVAIPNSVTSISSYAFSNCTNLTNIIIPNSVTSIDIWAFVGCTGLTSIIIPDSVTSIGQNAFSDCTNLTDITIPNSVTSIDYNAFYKTKWLENKQKENPLVIVNNILIDGKTCSGDVVIPNSVTSIDGCAFLNCTSLTNITIPSSITSISDNVFNNCTNLKSITIPDSVALIDEYAFYECTNLEDVYYSGTEEEWRKINISNHGNGSKYGNGNAPLLNATIHFNSKSEEDTTEPTEEATTAVTTTTKLTTTAIRTTTTKSTTTTRKTTTTTTSVTTTNETTFTTKQTATTTKSTKFVDGADNWSFPNSSLNFGSSYYMNDDYWNALLEGLSNKEKVLMNDNVKNEYWGGSCYGMAATSILACNSILNPENYQEGANFLHDISAPPTNEEKSLINYYFALQFTDVIQQKVCENFYSDDEKTKLQTLISCLENDTPTLLCFYGYFYGFSWGGHAVVAYGLEYGKYSIDGKAYNGKVMIYDNNNVDYSDDFCLYFNSSKGSWTIPYYELDSENDSRLGLITNDMKYINYHGYLNGTNDVSINNYIATLQSAAISGEYNLVKANYKNGSWINASTSEDDIKMLSSLSDNNFENSDLVFAMKDASSGYIMKTKNLENLDLSLSYENSLLSAKASNGTIAKFSPDGCVEIDGDSTSYSLGLVLNDGYTVTDWYGLTVDGKETDKAILKLEKDGYVLQSASLNNISVSGYNDSVTANVKFSTNYDKAYIYEIDEKTIGVAVDTDNNGTYETVIAKSDNSKDSSTETINPSVTYGDINSDGKVTIADAVLLNKYLVKSATLTDIQLKAADCLLDKEVNSSDTLVILKLIVGTYDSLPVNP